MYDPLLHYPLREWISSRNLADLNGAAFPFTLRLHANAARIKSLFWDLYGSRPDVEDQFWNLADDLYDMFLERPGHLKQQDLLREKDPYWLLSEKWVGMMMYVDRFAGTLNDIQQKIPYLEKLGINLIHLMPLLKSPKGSNDGGYAVSDYRSVDSRYGTLEDLKGLLESFRTRGMLTTLDLVMNHTSDQHEWAQRARRGESTYQAYYHMYPDRVIPDHFEEVMPEVFPESSPGNFTWIEELGKYVMSVFHSYQWDLNYSNPAVFREMLNILLYLANLGVDILRLDAVAFTWKETGTTCQNLPQAHSILQLLKACTEVVTPGTAFIAEAIVSPEEVIKYFGSGEARGKECEIAYHATFMASLWDAIATGETALLEKGLEELPSKPDRTTWITYLRCHDDIGFGFSDQHIADLGKDPFAHKQFLLAYYTGKFQDSTAKGVLFANNPKTGDARISGSLAALAGLEHARESGDQHLIDQAVHKILMLHAVILSFGGVPMLYYGDELGTGNNYTYLGHPDQAYDNRWIHRPVIQWEDANRMAQPGTIEQRLYDGLRRLITLRKASPEFADRNSCSIERNGNPHVFSYLRWNDHGARTFVMANFSKVRQKMPTWSISNCGINPLTLVDKISGQAVVVSDNHITLEPYEIIWATEPSTFEAFQAGDSGR